MEVAAYRQFADLEEDHFWFRGRRAIFFDLLDRLLRGREDLDVLEIGCGAGGLLRRLARYGRVKGLELSPDLSRMARERSGQPTFCADAYEVPLPDASQDLVCLFDTIEHIPDEARALAEIRRVLRPGGLVFFSVPAYQFLYSNNDRVAHHCRRYTRRRLRRTCEAAGLEVRRLTYFNTLLFPLILPAVLAVKFKERLFGVRDPERTNLSYRFPRLLNAGFARIMGGERYLLRCLSFPAGHSLIGVFARPAEGP
ncbi:MAG: class I SAM-dependent methyltransferase [Planctomycetota bacterium]